MTEKGLIRNLNKILDRPDGFLKEYYELEFAYRGRIKDIPDDKLKALRMRYPDESSEVSREPKIHVEKKLSKKTIQVKNLWDRGLTVDEMAKETNLTVNSIRIYLSELELPANRIYHYKITRGDEVSFAHSIRELAIKLNIKYNGAHTNVLKKAQEQGRNLEYGDWREPEVRRRMENDY